MLPKLWIISQNTISKQSSKRTVLWCFFSFLELDSIQTHSHSLYGEEQLENSTKQVCQTFVSHVWKLGFHDYCFSLRTCLRSCLIHIALYAKIRRLLIGCWSEGAVKILWRAFICVSVWWTVGVGAFSNPSGWLGSVSTREERRGGEG